MRAVFQGAYGSADVLQMREIATPAAAADEVLGRVRATSVHPTSGTCSPACRMLRFLGA